MIYYVYIDNGYGYKLANAPFKEMNKALNYMLDIVNKNDDVRIILKQHITEHNMDVIIFFYNGFKDLSNFYNFIEYQNLSNESSNVLSLNKH